MTKLIHPSPDADNTYFLPNVDSGLSANTPFFSVDDGMDARLGEQDSLAGVIFSAYQGKLPLAYDWQISGKPLPSTVIMSHLNDFPDYQSVATYPNQATETAKSITFLLENIDMLSARPHLQTQYKLCAIDGSSLDAYIPITGLQSVVALHNLVMCDDKDTLSNVVSLTDSDDSITFLQLTHYLCNSSRPYPPLAYDKEFFEDNIGALLQEKDVDDFYSGTSFDVVADCMLVCINGYGLNEFRELLSEIKLPSTNWVTHLLRLFKNPKFRLMSACTVAEENIDIFSLLAASIVGKPLSSIQRYLSNGSFATLGLAEQIDIIEQIKPLIENISIEV